jgi:hypothetical protein
MSVQDFNEALQSEVYKKWFNSLEKNIVSSTVDKLRSSQQRAAKTDFLITAKDVSNIFKSITGSAHTEDVQAMLQKLADNSGIDGTKGSLQKIAGQNAVLYKGIGFDTITEVLNRAFTSDEIEYYLYEQTELHKDRLKQELKDDPTLSKAEYRREWQKIDSMPNFSIGTFFDKGHVVSVATNLSKSFRNEIQKSSALADNIKQNLLHALDVYIKRLEEDDLQSANLSKEIYQSIDNIDYTKSVDKYLVEMQFSILNRSSGRASKAIIEELRKVFTPDSKEIEKVVNNSSTGMMLLESKSSPRFIDLIAINIVSILSTGKENKKVYKGKITKPIVKKLPVELKVNSNKKLIQDAKKLKSQIKANKPKVEKVKATADANLSLLSLQNLINQQLQDVVSANMGDGNSRNVLNYRTGRLASSAKVEYMSESRAGMITAFYSYMKNPYATFSDGGKQSSPRSRDPKLLISKSIREIAATQVGNRLRAVNV